VDVVGQIFLLLGILALIGIADRQLARVKAMKGLVDDVCW